MLRDTAQRSQHQGFNPTLCCAALNYVSVRVGVITDAIRAMERIREIEPGLGVPVRLS